MSEPAILGSISASKSSSFDTTSPDQDEAISPPADTDLTQSTWNPRIDNHGASPDTQPRQDQNLREVNAAAFHNNAFLRPVDTAVLQAFPAISTQRASPLSAELRVQTDLWMKPEIPVGVTPRNTVQAELLDKQLRKVPSSSKLPVRSHSIKSALAGAFYTGGSLSPASAASSPGVGPLSEITPLPSPIVPGGSPGPWKAMNELSNTSSTSPVEPDSTKSDTFLSPISYTKGSPKKRSYQGITSAAAGTIERDLILKANAANHDRNRTLSEYAPSPTPPRTRYNAVSGSQQPHTPAEPLSPKPMHREEYLAVQRGIATIQTPRPPTPPPSNRSATGSSDVESPPSSPIPIRGGVPLRYEATDIRTGELRRWSAIRQLGKGTFSTVMLATSEDKFDADENTKAEDQFDPKSLVAVKICEHGPAGGADEQKIQSSLKRELDILKAIDHPSLVHLQAVNVEEKRAFLVLNYAAGGDLFELASLQLDLLTPSLIRRIFAELVQAVRYLHSQYIVHRDIKLENVLVNISTTAIPSISDWQSHPTPIITLTDLGLGRWIARPPASPLLNTRCGSEDYAAPELLMGQEYDGRATDAWALGVLLYALMEGRLPFDPVPGSRRQSPTSHRIARCEWSWVRWGDRDGEWDEVRGVELGGGREIVEGLLKRARSRWRLDVVEQKEWVRGGIAVPGWGKRDDKSEVDGIISAI